MKNSGSFHISAQNIDCGYSLESLRRGGSNEYPQSIFLWRNKKNNIYSKKWGLRESKLYRYVFVMWKGVVLGGAGEKQCDIVVVENWLRGHRKAHM